MKVNSKNDWRQWNVAVTGINARSENPGPGLAVARCLVECPEFAGQVVGLGYDALDAGLYARELCRQSYLVPYPSMGEKALLARITQIHEEVGLDAIIPCLDAEIQNFARIEKQLAEMGIAMLIPGREQFNMRAKDRLSAFCDEIGVLVPESKIITDPGFFDSCADDDFDFPLVVKGIFYDAQVAYSAAEAKAIFGRLANTWGYPILVQKMVRGTEFDLASVGDGEGNLIGPVTMRKRALTDKGKAWSGVTVVDQGILDTACRIAKALRWRGPFEVEVMKSEEDKIYLIEINPRFPSWIYLSQAVGRNLPIAVLSLLAGEAPPEYGEAETGTFFIRYAQELIVQLSDFESVLIQGKLTDSTGCTTRTA